MVLETVGMNLNQETIWGKDIGYQLIHIGFLEELAPVTSPLPKEPGWNALEGDYSWRDGIQSSGSCTPLGLCEI